MITKNCAPKEPRKPRNSAHTWHLVTNHQNMLYMLAAGIAMALLTTAFGLAIAIPSLIMYMYLSGRVESLVMEMTTLGGSLVWDCSGIDPKYLPSVCR